METLNGRSDFHFRPTVGKGPRVPLHPATLCVSVAAVEVAEITAVGEPPGAVVQRGTEI